MRLDTLRSWLRQGLCRVMRWPLALLLGLACCAGTAHAASCGPASGQGTAPADFKNYCWIDFSSYNDALAQSAGGQSMSFTLPDGATVSFTIRTTNQGQTPSPAMVAVASPSWSGAAFGNVAFLGIPGQPVLYTAQNGGQVKVVLSNIQVAPPPGSGTTSTTYSMVVGDGESTNGGESLTFTTNGGAWTQLAQAANGAAYPTLAGVGTQTVTETGVNATVGSFVFGSQNNPTQISTTLVAGGLQGVVIGLRYASIAINAQLTGPRVNSADQFTYGLSTTTGTVLVSATTSGTATTGTAASLPTVTASFPTLVTQTVANGSVSTFANYSTSLTCTNANAGSSTRLPSGSSSNSYTLPALQYGDAISCLFTDTPYPSISGTVYADANHNSALDAAESGTGLAGLYIKLAPYSGGSCQGPATVAAPVAVATGAYTVPGVAPGNYCLVLTNSAALGNVTAYLPAGYVGTEAAGGVRVLTQTASPPRVQNFGLYAGSTLAVRVFADTGAGSGTANDGVQNGTEPGIAGLTVTATSGASAVATAVSDGTGLATLWLPPSVSGSVAVTPASSPDYLATGGSAGNTGGSYARPAVTFTFAGGVSYGGVAFGLVPVSTLAPSGTDTGPAGTTLQYPHTFVAGSSGSVQFGTTATATPTGTAFSQVIYQDTGCTGQLTAIDPVLTGRLSVTAGTRICVIVTDFIPANAPRSAQDVITLTAVQTYTGAAAPAAVSLVRTDTTTVQVDSGLQIGKLVRNITQGGTLQTSNSALPGDTLQYQLTLTNLGTLPLSAVVVNDTTPPFTAFASAACPATLPAGLTACAISTQPAAGAGGALQWVFTGVLAAGAQLAVTYNVTVAQ